VHFLHVAFTTLPPRLLILPFRSVATVPTLPTLFMPPLLHARSFACVAGTLLRVLVTVRSVCVTFCVYRSWSLPRYVLRDLPYARSTAFYVAVVDSLFTLRYPVAVTAVATLPVGVTVTTLHCVALYVPRLRCCYTLYVDDLRTLRCRFLPLPLRYALRYVAGRSLGTFTLPLYVARVTCTFTPLLRLRCVCLPRYRCDRYVGLRLIALHYLRYVTVRLYVYAFSGCHLGRLRCVTCAICCGLRGWIAVLTFFAIALRCTARLRVALPHAVPSFTFWLRVPHFARSSGLYTL